MALAKKILIKTYVLCKISITMKDIIEKYEMLPIKNKFINCEDIFVTFCGIFTPYTPINF